MVTVTGWGVYRKFVVLGEFGKILYTKIRGFSFNEHILKSDHFRNKWVNIRNLPLLKINMSPEKVVEITTKKECFSSVDILHFSQPLCLVDGP